MPVQEFEVKDVIEAYAKKMKEKEEWSVDAKL
jgi:hypothetical protein